MQKKHAIGKFNSMGIRDSPVLAWRRTNPHRFPVTSIEVLNEPPCSIFSQHGWVIWNVTRLKIHSWIYGWTIRINLSEFTRFHWVAVRIEWCSTLQSWKWPPPRLAVKASTTASLYIHWTTWARNSWFWKHKWCVQTATGTGTKISNTVDLRKLKTNLAITSLIALVDCETKPKFNTFHPSRQKHENNLVLQVVTSFGPIAVTFSGLFSIWGINPGHFEEAGTKKMEHFGLLSCFSFMFLNGDLCTCCFLSTNYKKSPQKNPRRFY